MIILADYCLLFFQLSQNKLLSMDIITIFRFFNPDLGTSNPPVKNEFG
jgi:hypothetical protein